MYVVELRHMIFSYRFLKDLLRLNIVTLSVTIYCLDLINTKLINRASSDGWKINIMGL